MISLKKIINKKISLFISFLIIVVYVFFNIYTSYSKQEENNNPHPVSTNLEVYILDVGQADSILITNNGHNMLIDAGNNADGDKLVNYLKSLGIEKFDYIIGTHPHEDHIGGLDDIINNFLIEEIYLPEAYTTTKTFEDVLDAIDNKGLNITVPEIGSTFKLGEADLKVLYTGTDITDLNNSSIILKMIFGNFSYLFTGDATSETEKILNQSDIQADILKVGHHGSAYSTSDAFLEKVKPKYAFISVAKENSYGHPAESTIKRLQNHNVAIYKTSELGTIKISSDGSKIEITHFATDTNG